MIITCGHEIDVDLNPNQQAQDLGTYAANAICGVAEMYPTWTFVGTDVYVGQDGGDPVIGSWRVNAVGTRTLAAQPPNNCAVLIQKRSALGGRKNRGRFYFPPMSLGESAVNENGVITGATLTGLQANFTEWFGYLNAGLSGGPTYKPVILHTIAPFTPTPVTSFVVQAQIATRRKRMRK